MRRKLLSLLVLGFVAAATPAWAQRSTSGTFGQRTLGGNVGAQGSSAFGGGGQAGGGMSGGSAAGAAGGGQADAGQISGNERFIRGARQPGQFVGAGATAGGTVGQQNAGGGALGGGLGGGMNGRGGTGQLGGLFGNQNMNQFGRNAQNMQNMNRGGQQQRQLRTPIRLGFDRPLVASPAVVAQFETRLTKIPSLKVTGPVRVTMEGSTAVLKGRVGSERDRDLAARLALLEPGISDVRNELEIQPGAPVRTPETVPVPAAEVTPPVND